MGIIVVSNSDGVVEVSGEGARVNVARLREMAFPKQDDDRTDRERELRVALQNALVAIRLIMRRT